MQTIGNPVPARRALPSWIRARIPVGETAGSVEAILRRSGVNTVCRAAACPNAAACFGRGTATFMILGDTCTRDCGFCAVSGGTPRPPDPREPRRVARAAQSMHLDHVVITSVTRDDLPDGGAAHFALVIMEVRRRLPQATIEVLTPDFGGRRASLARVLAAAPDVFNHNLETVRRLQARVRPRADYERSLEVLRQADAWRPRVWVKSGLMIGLGESDADIRRCLRDLYAAGCRLLTMGQYLAPSRAHLPVRRFARPETFARYAQWARETGFSGVVAAPLARSSFQAGRLLRQAAQAAGGTS